MQKRSYAKNKHDLAALLNISRPALSRLFKRSDYPPQVSGKGWDLKQWERYRDANIKSWRDTSGDEPRKASANLRDEAYIKRQELAAQREAFDLEVKQKKYVLKTEISDVITTNVTSFCRELDKAFRHELPPRLEGITAQEIARLLGQRLDSERKRMEKAFSESQQLNGNGAVH